MKPLCIDLYCGLGGWTSGFLAEGWDCIGFDIERHAYDGEQYPAQLVLEDVLTLDGAQFRDAAVIVASSPCQAYSYMAMPWTRAKQIARALRGQDEFPEGYTGYRTIAELNALFEAPKRIQREAIAAAGHHIPMIQENVRGAIPWVGRSQWNFGSYHLWGDVPALMPIPHMVDKVPGFRFDGSGRSFQSEAVKLGGGASWYPPDDPRRQPGLNFTRLAGQKFETERATVSEEGRKVGGDWFGKECHSPSRLYSSRSPARKAVSARIAKIPFALAHHIAVTYHPGGALGDGG
jgi:hypothetical protein